MKRLIEHILAEEYGQAGAELDAVMRNIMSRKLVEMKKAIVSETYVDDLDEAKKIPIGTKVTYKGKPGEVVSHNSEEGTNIGWRTTKQNITIHTVKLKNGKEIKDTADQFDVNEETIDEGKRFSIVRVRIRKGKVQRRRKVSNIKGYTFRKKGSGAAKLIRMTPMERRKRRLGAKRGKIKRRGKKARIQQKMRIVRRKRAALGLGYKNKKY